MWGLWLSVYQTTLRQLLLRVFNIITAGFQTGRLLYCLNFFLWKIIFLWFNESTPSMNISWAGSSFPIYIRETIDTMLNWFYCCWIPDAYVGSQETRVSLDNSMSMNYNSGCWTGSMKVSVKVYGETGSLSCCSGLEFTRFRGSPTCGRSLLMVFLNDRHQLPL